MELRHLRTIVAVAQHRSLTKAGEELYLSQSAVSQQIRRLEEELGIEVFRRTSRSVELTAEGHGDPRLRGARAGRGGRHAQRAGGDLRAAERPAAHRRRLPDRPLRHLRAAGRLPRGAPRRGDPHGRGDPGRRARPRCAPTSSTARSPRSTPTRSATSSRRRCCGRTSSWWRCRPGTALRAGARSRFEELAAEDLIAYRENSALRRRLERAMAERDLEPRNAFVCTEMAAVRGPGEQGPRRRGDPALGRRGARAADRAAADRPRAPDLADRPGLARRRAARRRRARRS